MRYRLAAVDDENGAGRVDLPAESKTNDAAQRLARLRAPARPQPEAIATNLEGLRVNEEVASRIVSMGQAELALGKSNELRPNLHDITPYSASLPVNVADGGLKGDLTRAFESSKLPTDLTGRYVYSNSATRLAPADPLFSTLAGYYQLYKKRNNPLELAIPSRYTPVRGTVPNLAPHDGALVAPVVTRTSVVFSLVYLAFYPGLGSFRGSLGWSQTKQYDDEVTKAEATYGPIYAKYAWGAEPPAEE